MDELCKYNIVSFDKAPISGRLFWKYFERFLDCCDLPTNGFKKIFKYLFELFYECSVGQIRAKLNRSPNADCPHFDL
jgi:hypothetical protein